MLEVESSIPNNLEFQPRNKHIECSTATTQKHTPINGGSFTKLDNYVDFRISNDGTFLNPETCRFNCKFTIDMAGGSSTDFDVYSSASVNSVVRGLEIRQGSELIENIMDYNRIYDMYSKVYCSNNQLSTGGSLTDLCLPPSESGTWNTSQQATTGRQMNTSVAANPPATYEVVNISVPLSLSNILGPSSNVCYPLALLGEPLFVRILLNPNIEEIIHVYTNTGGTITSTNYGPTSTYKLSDVSLSVEHIRYTPEVMNMITEGMPSELIYDGVQAISSTNSIGYANTERVILPNTSYQNVKNVLIQQFYPSLSTQNLNFGVSPLNGAFQSQLYIDGRNAVNNRNIGSTESSTPFNSNASYANSVLECNRPFLLCDDINCQLQPTKWVSATRVSYNFTTNNIGGGIGANSFPSDITSTVIPVITDFAFETTKPANPYFGYVGFNLEQNTDPSRAKVGINCKGRQMVYEVRQNNNISSSTTRCTIQAVLSVGVKYVLDRKTRTLRVIY